ncbi:glycosyltransferase family 25 protein [Helicobacter pylori]|uniref:glycosyltransferase family 25 protein n=1 Tax=Helicobacter pylori TaxID=210 RepID=UPI001FD412F9|nr:glycosyltransferase family 25 protein [Helicobacter pylori]UOR86937.1 glycosyltransferase family 25 protein [Helicobacter pylori]
MIQVYIISLKESQRRLDTEKLVLESNEKFKGRCVFQIFDAISPKHQDFEKFVQELYDAQNMLKSDWFHSDYCYQELLPREFGCYLSHYFLWKECVKTDQPVVILEDDVALESNFMQALEDCLKSPFDFVRLYGCYWYYHETKFHVLPKEFVFPPFDYPFKNNPILEKFKKFFDVSRFLNLSTHKVIHYILKKIQKSYYSMHEKEAFFLEHFYLTSVYVASTAGYYLTPKGAKTFIEATERFKIIEPVDMFINNPTYHDIANFTYVPCPVSLNKHAFNSTIQNAKKPDISLKPPKKSYFDNLFYNQLNTRKCLRAFHKYSRQYDHLKIPKEV